MRIKTIMTACLAVPALSVLCLLSSCSSEELPTTEKPSTGPQTLTLNLKPAGTRAAAYTDPGTAAENTINSVTIGIFGIDNKVKTIQEQTTTSTSPTINTSQLIVGDQVLVAVNAKSGTFNGALTVSDFENKTLAIDDALAGGNGSATTVANTKLPMFGTGSIVQGGSATAFTAAVDVYHMVSKITLQSLYVDFDATGAYMSAKFTPTEVFMYNVSDKLDFYPASSYTYPSVSTLYNGEAGKASVKDYLGTGTTLTPFSPTNPILSGLKTGTTYSWGAVGTKILFLYTMPSNSASPTQLVIKGTFDPDGTNDPLKISTVYYPVNINYNSADGSAADISGGGKDGTPKQVYPNKNYIVDVTIKGKGASSPSASLDPQTATANITVKSFVDASQSNTFN